MQHKNIALRNKSKFLSAVVEFHTEYYPYVFFPPPETQMKEMPNERMDLAEEVNGPGAKPALPLTMAVSKTQQVNNTL